MFFAHMDEIGFFVTNVDENGTVKISNIGDINYLSFAYSKVVSQRGVCGILTPYSSDKVPECKELYIDIGANDRISAEEKVKVGDFFVAEPKFEKLSDNVYTGVPFDNRVGCFALIESIKEVEKTENDLYFVFTTQNEAGKRGAKSASYAVKPEMAICVDTQKSDTLGEGVNINLKNGRTIFSSDLKEKMHTLAKKRRIRYKDVVISEDETDSSSVLPNVTEYSIGCICVPCKNIHTQYEMINTKDIFETVKLIVAVAEEV